MLWQAKFRLTCCDRVAFVNVPKQVVLWLDLQHTVEQVYAAQVAFAIVAVADTRCVRDQDVRVVGDSFKSFATRLSASQSKSIIAKLGLPRRAVKLVAKALHASVVQQRKVGQHVLVLVQLLY